MLLLVFPTDFLTWVSSITKYVIYPYSRIVIVIVIVVTIGVVSVVQSLTGFLLCGIERVAHIPRGLSTQSGS